MTKLIWTPRNALKLTGSEELCSDMIGLVNLWIAQLFLWIMVIGSYIGKLMLVESSWWLHYLRLTDDGAKTHIYIYIYICIYIQI